MKIPSKTPLWLGSLLILVLALLAGGRSALGTRQDSFTVDEPWHIVAGTTYVRHGDFALNPEHPPLVKLWVGAFAGSDVKLRPKRALTEKAQEREWVEQTFFFDNDAAAVQKRVRLAMWSFHALLLAILGLLLWRAFGLAWAVGTLAFLALEPTVGAHLPVVMTDLPLALTLMIAAITAGLLAGHWQWRWVLGCGVAFALALGAKHSSLAGLAGLGAGLWLAALWGWRSGRWRELARRHAQLAACAFVAIALLWAQYGFRFHAAADGSDSFNRPMPEKIAELRLPHWREGIAFADRHQLLPRPYLWGLADTVRTGVEGRSIGMHFVWGRTYYGNPPWFSWPLMLLSKLPLALLALSIAALPLLLRTSLSPAARWSVAGVLAACAFHMIALVGSGGIWGGVRHALPVIAGAAVIGGGALAWAWRQRSRPALAMVAACYVAAGAMTLREPRLWEYHNELVGGTANSYRYFTNEGLDLGQRFDEVRRFHDRVIVASSEPLYVNYWMGEQQTRAARMRFRRPVESLDDTNVEGVYRGWFVYAMTDTLPWPQWDWDPKVVFKDMKLVARHGHVGIWHGTLRRPQTRAGSMSGKVMDYIYKENGRDWALIAQRLEEVAAHLPGKVDAGVELGNAYLRLGQREQAVSAYRRLLEQKQVPVEPLLATQLRDQIGAISSAGDLAQVQPMRNPWME